MFNQTVTIRKVEKRECDDYPGWRFFAEEWDEFGYVWFDGEDFLHFIGSTAVIDARYRRQNV